MKILVVSDSHSSLTFMRLAMERINPDVVVHLGDYYDDGRCIAEDHPNIRFFQVVGNCDRFSVPAWADEILSIPIGGVQVYMTHGHKHRVKQGIGQLVAAARVSGAQIALYGHTHEADCHMEEDGLWVMNPGSCRGFGGSVGIITIENEKITACRILEQADLEVYK